MISDKQSFDSRFEVFLADTPESKQIHYNLRYQVYCDEMGYEDRDAFPDRLEFDEWDMHSCHFLVRDKRTGRWIGALRLVFHDSHSFPFEGWSDLEKKISIEGYRKSVELSRLCVLKEVRRFSAKLFAPYGLLDNEQYFGESSNITVLYNYNNLGLTIMWGLLRAGALYCTQRHITDWYLLVAPALARAINKEGFDLEQIGEPCHHRGKRIPFRWNIDSFLENPIWQKDYRNEFRLYSDEFEKCSGGRKLA